MLGRILSGIFLSLVSLCLLSGVAQGVEVTSWKTVSIRPQFVGEENGASRFFGSGSKVIYLGERERSVFKVQFKDGKILNAKGEIMDSEGSAYIYVMDKKGDFYISEVQRVGLFHHSSLLAGQDVAAAGEIVIRNGEVSFLNNQSGHYQPPPEVAMQALLRLAELKVPVQEFEWYQRRDFVGKLSALQRIYFQQKNNPAHLLMNRIFSDALNTIIRSDNTNNNILLKRILPMFKDMEHDRNILSDSVLNTLNRDIARGIVFDRQPEVIFKRTFPKNIELNPADLKKILKFLSKDDSGTSLLPVLYDSNLAEFQMSSDPVRRLVLSRKEPEACKKFMNELGVPSTGSGLTSE